MLLQTYSTHVNLKLRQLMKLTCFDIHACPACAVWIVLYGQDIGHHNKVCWSSKFSTN